MSDRFNTIAGWTLFSGIVLLGASAVSSRYFHADKHQRPEKMGFEIAGVVQEGEGGKAAEPIEALLATADPAKGQKTFAKCASCHNADQGGAAGLGPNLFGVLGKSVASGGFAYSEALKGKGGKWDWAAMNTWLTNPAAYAPGTAMSFAGLSDPKERANLLVYLNSKGSNLPLPAVPAAAPAEGAPAEAAKEAPKGK
ncbi:MAG: cytochrome c family protein [Novosphingobium sp.]